MTLLSLLHKYNEKIVERAMENKSYPEFRPGDTIKVNFEIIEGTNKRVQAFEGVCIKRKNKKCKAMSASFTVRKISQGDGVERTFPLYSPRIISIDVIKKGKVKRAKLYYLRNLKGKAARIKERA